MNTIGFTLSSNLPNTLNPNEVSSYFEEFHQGNMQARNILIEKNLRLIKYIISKYFKEVPIEEEELFSIGMIGLIKAVDTYNPSKNIKFPTYATKCIYNEILMFIRKEQKHTRNISMESSITHIEDDKELQLKDFIKDGRINITEDYENKEEYQTIRQILDTLPERDKLIIMLYFGFINNSSMTQPQIANIFGINQSLVSRRITKAIEIITLELEKYDYVIKKEKTKRRGRQKK